MQILGKRSKVLLVVVAIVMLTAVGVSFAMWDNMSTVNATNGDLSSYANAKVGDIIEFGRYYQTLETDEKGEYIKSPIEWIVVDKDERTGQLTLMSKYILACGSYFGNWYDDGTNNRENWYYNNKTSDEIGGVPYNQAYAESTSRAFLNNLERLDMGGDSFDAIKGYKPSVINSTYDKTINGVFTKGTGLLSSIGYSNQRYWTGLKTTSSGNMESILSDTKSGLYVRNDSLTEVYYKRPIVNDEFKARPVTRGFFDEAFTDEQKAMIIPKVIPGYIGHRWPDSEHNIATKSYVDSAIDKVWLPSATELNIMQGLDWNNEIDDEWISPSDEASSKVFEYFANFQSYGHSSVAEAIKSSRTVLASNGMIGNYSIPVYDIGTTTPKTAISSNDNTSDQYWTRSPVSYWFHGVRVVDNLGRFFVNSSHYSHVGVRPCVILKY